MPDDVMAGYLAAAAEAFCDELRWEVILAAWRDDRIDWDYDSRVLMRALEAPDAE